MTTNTLGAGRSLRAEPPTRASGHSTILQEKLLLLVAAASVVVGLFYLAYFLVVGFGGVSFLVVGIVAVGALPAFYARATGRPWGALNAQSAALFVFIAGVALLQDGVDSPALRWLVVPPCIALLAGSEALAVSLLALSVVEVVILALHGPGSWGPISLLAPQPFRQTAVATSLSTLFVTLIVGNGARWSRGLQRALELAHDAATAGAAAQARFVSHLSHELRTPLQGLVGATDILAANHLDIAQREQLVGIQAQSVKAVLGLLNDVLDFSKLEANKMMLKQSRLDPRALIFEINEQFAVQAFSKGLELTSTCDPNVPRALVGDAMRIRQVIGNLVSNAVKFTSSGGVHVHVCTDTGSAAGADPLAPRLLRIEVQDTGIGMSRSCLDSIFTPFHQADETVAQRYGGTGLGLSISKAFAELMGGRVDVVSTVGAGTIFTLSLPLRPDVVTSAASGKIATRGVAFIATPSVGLFRHLSAHLEGLGLRVDRSEGLPDPEALRRSGPRLVIVDACLLATGATEVAFPWGDLSSSGGRVVVVSPLVGDHVTGTVPGALVLHKPVSRSSLEALLDGLSQAGSTTASHPSPASSSESGGGPVVLVAEDDPVNQIIVARMLRSSGADVLMVEDGLAALELLKRQRVALVLMDVRMPHLDGLAATRALREWEGETGNVATPVVAMTGHHETEDLQACREAGMDSSLVKPFHLEELRLTLAEHLPKRAACEVMSTANSPCRPGAKRGVP